ncbi:MAG: 4Fe-4S dicluster domain-containing protein [Planctomycetes bacterium]|nr:4Fe-4S dicluster domain-containing protein [Planctomycetota bacterium]MCC7172394.1 4Fe-4S dicluster domain-containing protein [Planctomycetota bacterium]
MNPSGRVSRRALLFLRQDETPQAPSVAVIRVWKCLAHTGGFCSVCVEHCPVAGAITLEHGKPRIALDRCTGCGVCIDACPAPEPAIQAVARRRSS